LACSVVGGGCAGMNLFPTPVPPTPRVDISPLFSSQVYDRIAVYVEDRSGRLRRQEGALRSVEDEFMRTILSKGYVLAARSDIEAILGELDLQESSITEEVLAEKAKALNVSAVLLVSVNQLVTVSKSRRMREYGSDRTFTERYYETTGDISARLISAELAQVVWISGFTGVQEVEARNEEVTVLPHIAQVVASGLPPKG